MPKRSNEFQKLAFLVKKHAAAGAEIRESKLLRDHVTGKEREVDICVESTVAGHLVIVSIECRGRARRADVAWVEEMKAKHERLPTNALVLVSRSGFTKEAGKVARTYGIETLVLKDVDKASVERLFSNTSSLWSKIFTLTPTKVVIGVKQTENLPKENVTVLPDNLIYDHDGRQMGSAKELVEILLHVEHVGREFGKLGDKPHKGFRVRWEPARDKAGNPLCLQKLEPKVLRPIRFVHITGTCSFEVSQFPLTHAKLGNTNVAWGTGSFLGKDAILVASEDDTGDKKLSISTENITVSRPSGCTRTACNLAAKR